jgi:hypothetical protein
LGVGVVTLLVVTDVTIATKLSVRSAIIQTSIAGISIGSIVTILVAARQPVAADCGAHARLTAALPAVFYETALVAAISTIAVAVVAHLVAHHQPVAADSGAHARLTAALPAVFYETALVATISTIAVAVVTRFVPLDATVSTFDRLRLTGRRTTVSSFSVAIIAALMSLPDIPVPALGRFTCVEAIVCVVAVAVVALLAGIQDAVLATLVRPTVRRAAVSIQVVAVVAHFARLALPVSARFQLRKPVITGGQ